MKRVMITFFTLTIIVSLFSHCNAQYTKGDDFGTSLMLSSEIDYPLLAKAGHQFEYSKAPNGLIALNTSKGHRTENHTFITLPLEQRSIAQNATYISNGENEKNRRLIYSSLWVFASLNYLYADLVGLMDHNMLSQYLTGEVNGMEMSPEFLTVAAAFMQIPMANIFLPHVIKNDNTLRWIQIASGAIMTLVQTSTLFVDEPAPYYALFSGVEIATTTYITIDAFNWKTRKK